MRITFYIKKLSIICRNIYKIITLPQKNIILYLQRNPGSLFYKREGIPYAV